MCQRIGDQPEEAVIAFNLGRAYKDIPALRDLAQAERWYRRSLELFDERDRLGRGRCTIVLGTVAYERFKEARDATPTPALPLPGGGSREEVMRQHLNTALDYYHQALDLLPPNAVNDLAVAHNQLGNFYEGAGDLDRALTHYREAARYFEAAGAIYNAATVRRNVSLALLDTDRLADALAYAQAALRGFSTFGDRAADMIQRTQGLIALIQQKMQP